MVHVVAEDNGTAVGGNKTCWSIRSLSACKRAYLSDAYGEVYCLCEGCSNLEELVMKNRYNGVVFATQTNFLSGVSAKLRTFLIDPTSVAPSRYWSDWTAQFTVNTWGNGKSKLSLESLKSLYAYFGRGGNTTKIVNPVTAKYDVPTKYTHTLGRLGLDIDMVDNNGIKCVISKEEAEAQNIEYDWLDETETYCVRKDSELCTALDNLETKGIIWTLVFN